MSYRIVAVERDGQWRAHAEREDTGSAFGIVSTGATRDQAVDGLSRWLEWQGAHTAALLALQVAERLYHRTLAGAFAVGAHAPVPDAKNEALAALDAARIRLDRIRARQPERSS